MIDRSTIVILCASFCFGLLLVFVLEAVKADPNQPRLVGYGCEGSRGPLYAYEEDHFPVCDVIEGL